MASRCPAEGRQQGSGRRGPGTGVTARMPLAPRPHPGESLSSWIRRMASRYDIGGQVLAHAILGGPAETVGRVEALDYRQDAALEAALAVAAGLDPARVIGMRKVGADGGAAGWIRQGRAWCPDCVRADIGQYGEVHERAVWRLGCWVACPVHGRPMQSTCPRCELYDRQAPCSYRAVGGLLRLVCNVCNRLVDDGGGRNWLDDQQGVFGIVQTPSLVALVQDFQTGLTKVLEGEQPCRTWGFGRIGRLLLTITTDLTLAFVLSTGIRVAARLDCSQVIRREPRASWFEPVTLALLSPFMAFGLMALTASMLRSLSDPGPVQH